MPSLLPNAKAQFVDANGLPLVGGSVGFYSPGTLNPLPTYQDQGGTIANTNPIALDSRGQAIIWGSGIFRQIVKDVNGVTIWDQIVASTDSAFTGSNGASLIGFDSTNLSNILTTRLNRVVDSVAALRALSKATYTRAFVTGYYAPHDGGGGAYQYDPSDTTTADNSGSVIVATDGGRWKLQTSSPLSVKQFGAKGDSTTDDTTAITAALNGMGAGTLYFPPGTFMVSGTFTLGVNQYIIGSGQGATTINSTSLTADVFLMPNTQSGISELTIAGLVTRTAGRFIFDSAVGPTYINNVFMANYFTGIELNGNKAYVTNITMVGTCSASGACIKISGGNDHFVNQVQVDNASNLQPAAGIYITSCLGSYISNCSFIHCSNGVLMQATGTDVISFMFFETVVCDTGTNAGWNLITFNTAKIYECGFSNCWGSSFTNCGFQTQQGSTGGSIDGLLIANFRSLNNGRDGLLFQGNTQNVYVTGGISAGNSQTTPTSFAGVHIAANVSAVSLVGMRCGPSAVFADSQLAQVQVDAGSGTQIAIVGCNLATSHTPITMLATGNNNVIEGCVGFLQEGFITATTDAAGHIVVTHGSGAIPKSMTVTASNSTTALFMQTDTPTTANFRVCVFSAGGAVLANTAVSLSWRIGF